MSRLVARNKTKQEDRFLLIASCSSARKDKNRRQQRIKCVQGRRKERTNMAPIWPPNRSSTPPYLAC